MKKQLTILVLLTGFVLSAQTNDGWEDWQKTSCYSKISFRLKYDRKNGQQHIWKVQFRNDFPDVISFNYHVTDKLQQYNLTTHRKALNPGQISDELEVYTTEEDIYLLVDKVSISPYPEEFIECDQ
jgi:hypothetical protein